MTEVSSELRGLRYGPAEEGRLMQTGTRSNPNSPGKQRACPESHRWREQGEAEHNHCKQIWVSSTFLRLVTLPARKAKTRLKSANTEFVMNRSASSDYSCLHLKEKGVPKNVKAANVFLFGVKMALYF